MLRFTSLALWLWDPSPVLGQLPEWGGEDPVLEFCNAAGDCERQLLSPGFPSKLCAAPADLPPWWASPFAQLRLRLHLEGDIVSQPRFKRSAVPHRGFCEWIGPVAARVCTDCKEQRCEGVVRTILGTRDYAANLPPRGGCAIIEQLPKGTKRARARWEWSWDPMVPVCLLAGWLLVDCWRELSSSSTLHAAMGGVGSLAFVAALIVFWIIREFRGTVANAVPFGGTLTAVSVFFFTVIPALRETVMGWLWGWLQTSDYPVPSDFIGFLNMQDPVFHLPIGWILFAVVVLGTCATLSFGANLSRKYFASAPEPEGDVQFYIDAQGRRVDVLPPTPGPQWMLGLLIWLLGVALLASGSHSDAFSLAVCAVCFLKDSVGHVIMTTLVRRPTGSPGDFRQLISAEAWKRQKQERTQMAMEALRNFVKDRPAEMAKVRQDSELFLRRFADGAPHVNRPADSINEAGRGMCTVL